MKKEQKKLLRSLITEARTEFRQKIEERAKNLDWILLSADIVLHIQEILDNRELSQKDFAELLDVSPQQVNKWLNSETNFTLSTITKIQNALDVKLIQPLSVRE